MEVNLLPIGFKKYMKVLKSWGMWGYICTISIVAIIMLTSFDGKTIDGVMLSLLCLIVFSPMTIPAFFGKISQSTVRFDTDKICILDKRGKCWRTIDYNAITNVREEEISGFFYGARKEEFKAKYVCVFLNGLKIIPDVSYAKLFTDPNFIMIGYSPEVFDLLYTIKRRNQENTGDKDDNA